MTESRRSQYRWWIVIGCIVCAASMWVYVNRVLIAYQVDDAAAHDRPRGNLSDLYPRWLGARELLLRGRNPYGVDVTREIQEGYYGRVLDPSRRGDPHDQAGFAYPVYVVFFLAPSVRFPFPVIQRLFFWLLLVITSGTTILWLRVVRWAQPVWAQLSLIALTLGSIAAMQGLKLQQISLLVAGLIAAAIVLLIYDHAALAGILLAMASVKPQLVLLLLAWLAIWMMGDWRKRYGLATSFLVSMAILCAVSEWYLPHWIRLFWQAVRQYQNYAENTSVLDGLIGKPWSWFFEIAAAAALLNACWRERRNKADTERFGFTVSMILAGTILLIPTSAQYNQVLLIPALLMIVKERRLIWGRGVLHRAFLLMTIILTVWPWVSAGVLAGLSFVLPPPAIERAWAVPLWTTVQTPVMVAALMLFHYYQGTFGASREAGTS
jgi:hypothetical protein